MYPPSCSFIKLYQCIPKPSETSSNPLTAVLGTDAHAHAHDHDRVLPLR